MIRSLNRRVPSSALGHAISFLLLIGLICTGILFISSANKRIELNYEMDEHLLFNNYFALTSGVKFQESGQFQMIHPSGDTSIIIVKEWGGYRAVVSTTLHGNKKVQKSALVGFESIEKYPVLYLPNNRQVVKLCGKTLIEGTVYTSERGFERGYIAGKQFEGNKLLDGEKIVSDKYLPPLNPYIKEMGLETFREESVKIEAVTSDSVYMFTERTSLWTSVDPIQLINTIEGNIIIHSFDSIFVSSFSRLKNVILIAPVIHFEKGFKGSVQGIASKRITCEEDVILNYPSALILHTNDETDNIERREIYLGTNSKVMGGILLISDKPNFRNPVYLEIDHAIVGGLIYNQGITEIKGKVIGSVYTSQLGLKTGGGEYTNYLLDATLSTNQLPKAFVMPNWLGEENGVPILLTCF